MKITSRRGSNEIPLAGALAPAIAFGADGTGTVRAPQAIMHAGA